jgi:hypothetical protein
MLGIFEFGILKMSIVDFHSILINGFSSPQLENHQAYCSLLGYHHKEHRLFSPNNSIRAKLLYKYNIILQALNTTPHNHLLVFADDAAVIYDSFPADDVLNDTDYWIAAHSNTGKGDACYMIFKNTLASKELIENALELIRITSDPELDLLSGFELANAKVQPFSPSERGGYYPNLPFASFGHTLPRISAYVLSLNPAAHPNLGDARTIDTFVEYLNSVRGRGITLYSDLPIEDAASVDDFEVTNPGRPIALITCYTPHISLYAQHSAKNVQEYCKRHGYTHYLYRNLPPQYLGKITGNWIKPKLLLEHFADHDKIAWVDSDIIIHDLNKPLTEIMQNNEMAIARDVSIYPFNSGFMAFSNTQNCRDYLEKVEQLIDTVLDKNGVYASGGDQSYFIQAWEAAGGHGTFPLSDSMSFNTHPAMYDNHTFALHYMGYPNALRALMMKNDIEHLSFLENLPNEINRKSPVGMV